jgi:hypothetical protein
MNASQKSTFTIKGSVANTCIQLGLSAFMRQRQLLRCAKLLSVANIYYTRRHTYAAQENYVKPFVKEAEMDLGPENHRNYSPIQLQTHPVKQDELQESVPTCRSAVDGFA